VSLTLADVWSAAAVLLGFQLAAFTWRLQRELKMAAAGEITWLPLADMVNLVAFVVVAGGVFVLPILGVSDRALPRNALGLGVLLLAFYPFALLGHYELYWPYSRSRQRSWCPYQERIVLVGAAVAVITYILVAIT
jgi:hypothetical protein